MSACAAKDFPHPRFPACRCERRWRRFFAVGDDIGQRGQRVDGGVIGHVQGLDDHLRMGCGDLLQLGRLGGLARGCDDVPAALGDLAARMREDSPDEA